MRLSVAAIFLSLLVSSFLCAEEMSTPNRPSYGYVEGTTMSTPKIIEVPRTSYALPRDQVQEYRALEAESRALKAESTLALQDIESKRSAILEKWKVLVGGNLQDWQLDLKEGKLIFGKTRKRSK